MKPSRVVATIVLGLIGLIVLFLALPRSVYAVLPRNFFVTNTGGGTSCTQPTPCSLATALSQVNDGDSVYVAGGTYIGSGANTNVITITNSIQLYGGWDGAASGSVVRNPTTHPTTLDGQRQRRVIRVTGDVTPTIDGFIITRGNATGLTSNCNDLLDPEGCGAGILVRDAHPIISNNIITNNIAVITSTSTTNNGYGGGLLLINADRAIISGNVIISNTAELGRQGHGGGIHVFGSSEDLQIKANQILSNYATFSYTVGWGGGIALEYLSGSGLKIEDNRIQGNYANNGSGYGAGIYTWYGAGRIAGNTIIGNYGNEAVLIGHWIDGSSYIRNNWIVDNLTNYGISFDPGSNVIATNNVVDVGNNHYAIFILGAIGDPVSVTLKHNTLHGAGTGTGVYVNGHATVWMTNTIISNFSVGVTNAVPANSDAYVYKTLMNSTPIDYGSNVFHTGTVVGFPKFVNAAANDFHITLDSDALNAGLDIGVTDDIDGQTRPMRGAPDIGADEVPYYVSLPLVLKNH